MINKIFWDIDETLIYTSLHPPEQEHIFFSIDEDIYYTIVRPCAKRLIEFSRELVGEENVFILTTSTREYATNVNRLALFGFKDVQIWPREDIQKHYYPTAYGGQGVIPHAFADPENILIDNLPPRYNDAKIGMIGIGQTYHERYFQCRDYYGIDFPNDPFENDVKKFLTNLHEYETTKTIFTD